MVNKSIKTLKSDIQHLDEDQGSHYKKKLGLLLHEYMQDFLQPLLNTLTQARNTSLTPAMQKAYFTDPSGNVNDLITELHECSQFYKDFVSYTDKKGLTPQAPFVRTNAPAQPSVPQKEKTVKKTVQEPKPIEEKNEQLDNNITILHRQTELLLATLQQLPLAQDRFVGDVKKKDVDEFMNALTQLGEIDKQVDALYTILATTPCSKKELDLLFKNLEAVDTVAKDFYDRCARLEKKCAAKNEHAKNDPEALSPLARYVYCNELLPEDVDNDVRTQAASFTRAPRIAMMQDAIELLMKNVEILFLAGSLKLDGGVLNGQQERLGLLLHTIDAFDFFIDHAPDMSALAQALQGKGTSSADGTTRGAQVEIVTKDIVTLAMAASRFADSLREGPAKNRAMLTKHVRDYVQKVENLVAPLHKALVQLQEIKDKPLTQEQESLLHEIEALRDVLQGYQR
jgi:hypothetical protein